MNQIRKRLKRRRIAEILMLCSFIVLATGVILCLKDQKPAAYINTGEKIIPLVKVYDDAGKAVPGVYEEASCSICHEFW
jgi:hypothetical protein